MPNLAIVSLLVQEQRGRRKLPNRFKVLPPEVNQVLELELFRFKVQLDLQPKGDVFPPNRKNWRACFWTVPCIESGCNSNTFTLALGLKHWKRIGTPRGCLGARISAATNHGSECKSARKISIRRRRSQMSADFLSSTYWRWAYR